MSKHITLNIVEVDGGYRATCDEFPGMVINGSTYGLTEAKAIDAVNSARHSRDIDAKMWEMREAEAEEAVIRLEIAKRRGRPPKVAPVADAPAAVVEGADVPNE